MPISQEALEKLKADPKILQTVIQGAVDDGNLEVVKEAQGLYNQLFPQTETWEDKMGKAIGGLTEGGLGGFALDALTAPFKMAGEAVSQIPNLPTNLSNIVEKLKTLQGTEDLAKRGLVLGAGAVPGGNTLANLVLSKWGVGLQPDQAPEEWTKQLRNELTNWPVIGLAGAGAGKLRETLPSKETITAAKAKSPTAVLDALGVKAGSPIYDKLAREITKETPEGTGDLLGVIERQDVIPEEGTGLGSGLSRYEEFQKNIASKKDAVSTERDSIIRQADDRGAVPITVLDIDWTPLQNVQREAGTSLYKGKERAGSAVEVQSEAVKGLTDPPHNPPVPVKKVIQQGLTDLDVKEVVSLPGLGDVRIIDPDTASLIASVVEETNAAAKKPLNIQNTLDILNEGKQIAVTGRGQLVPLKEVSLQELNQIYKNLGKEIANAKAFDARTITNKENPSSLPDPVKIRALEEEANQVKALLIDRVKKATEQKGKPDSGIDISPYFEEYRGLRILGDAAGEGRTAIASAIQTAGAPKSVKFPNAGVALRPEGGFSTYFRDLPSMIPGLSKLMGRSSEKSALELPNDMLNQVMELRKYQTGAKEAPSPLPLDIAGDLFSKGIPAAGTALGAGTPGFQPPIPPLPRDSNAIKQNPQMLLQKVAEMTGGNQELINDVQTALNSIDPEAFSQAMLGLDQMLPGLFQSGMQLSSGKMVKSEWDGRLLDPVDIEEYKKDLYNRYRKKEISAGFLTKQEEAFNNSADRKILPIEQKAENSIWQDVTNLGKEIPTVLGKVARDYAY